MVSGDRINKFKDNYQPQVIAKIDTLASEMKIPYKINTYLEQAFSHLNETQTAFFNEVDDLFTLIHSYSNQFSRDFREIYSNLFSSKGGESTDSKQSQCYQSSD